MITIQVGDDLRARCPKFCLGLIEASVNNTPTHDALWVEIDTLCRTLQETVSVEDANRHPQIVVTREAYKRCGKDPNRYRPSAEALRRRILQGKPLYRVSTLVDLVNFASLKTGYSIGAFDLAKAVGPLCWGIGREGEPYEGIGRGVLNIAGLPVLRDATAAIGTPTSDSERTKLSLETRRLLYVINAYGGRTGLEDAVRWLAERLATYAAATEVETAVTG
ncbi:MAG: hypothetical protein K8T26_04320 [Lentisphaerae bacterium]|nr:hypothetical protein [Lentisphaerota bacterium]